MYAFMYVCMLMCMTESTTGVFAGPFIGVLSAGTGVDCSACRWSVRPQANLRELKPPETSLSFITSSLSLTFYPLNSQPQTTENSEDSMTSALFFSCY